VNVIDKAAPLSLGVNPEDMFPRLSSPAMLAWVSLYQRLSCNRTQKIQLADISGKMGESATACSHLQS
jgi:hypothetical protein